MAVKVSEAMLPEETVGEFLYRIAEEEILTEESTDKIAGILSELVRKVIPIPWIDWLGARFLRRLLDRQMPEVGLWAVREILQKLGMLKRGDAYYHPKNPFRNRRKRELKAARDAGK